MFPCVQNDYSHNGGSFRHELNELQFLTLKGFDPKGFYGLVSLGILTGGPKGRGSRLTR